MSLIMVTISIPQQSLNPVGGILSPHHAASSGLRESWPCGVLWDTDAVTHSSSVLRNVFENHVVNVHKFRDAETHSETKEVLTGAVLLSDVSEM